MRDPGIPALRTHRVELVADGGESDGISRLIVDYWVPLPESKRMLMVRFSTPLGDLQNLMLALFDEFLAAALFRRRGSLREQLIGNARSAPR